MSQFVTLEVEDFHFGNGSIETTIKGHRHGAEPQQAGYARFQALVDAHLSPKAIAAAVPAYVAMQSVRRKAAQVAGTVRQCEADELRAQRELQQLVADGDGEGLAIRLGRAEAAAKAATAKLAEARAGAAVFRANLERAEATAKAAVIDHLQQVVLGRFHGELCADEKALRAESLAVLGPVLDRWTALKTVQQLAGSGATSRLGGQIEQLLSAAPEAIA